MNSLKEGAIWHIYSKQELWSHKTPVVRKRLCKHPLLGNELASNKEAIEIMFSMQSMPRLYNWDPASNGEL
jgi:hypothetical protein